MIKRILVALDPDEDTPVATQYAIRLAKRFDASLTGLVVVDLSSVRSNVGTVGIGMEEIGLVLWDHLNNETRRVAGQLLDAFQASAEKAGVRYREVKKTGVSYKSIIDESKYHDILVIGRDSHFFYYEPDHDTKTLAKVVKNGVVPVLVVTDEYKEIEKLLVAFDGSAAASRSLKSFVHLLPYGNDLEIELVNIAEGDSDDDIEKSRSLLDQVENYLREHNFHYIQKTVLESDDPGDSLIELQKMRKPDLVLLGAHAVSAIQRVTFGSTTHDMITRGSGPLFLAP